MEDIVVLHCFVGRAQIHAQGRSQGRGCEHQQAASHIQVHLPDLVQAPVSEVHSASSGPSNYYLLIRIQKV